MPRYEYVCPKCGNETEAIKPMVEADTLEPCDVCGTIMVHDFQAENVLVGAGRRSYHKPIVSDSMAVAPNQVAEHRRLFPDVKVLDDGRPVFDNFSDHEKYMKKCNIEKVPQKTKKRGKRIS